MGREAHHGVAPVFGEPYRFCDSLAEVVGKFGHEADLGGTGQRLKNDGGVADAARYGHRFVDEGEASGVIGFVAVLEG